MNKSAIPSKKEVTYLRRKLLNWFSDYGRSYPWRSTNDPYRVLIAEMMLQRTRADQVEGVYKEFFRKYDRPEKVSETPQEDLNKVLESLGLRWRFKRFKQVSKVLIERFNGVVPDTRNKLNQLPGVGQYVSGLVASVAFNKKEWIVDSNVVRVFERFFGLDTQKEARRDPKIINTAKKYIETTKPREANLGLIDFGALVCMPREPEFKSCPVKRKCQKYQSQNKE